MSPKPTRTNYVSDVCIVTNGTDVGYEAASTFSLV